ncbi:methyl-accepting chemotaxis protein [Thalassospira lucentensis]|uniref:methyl-accepting chemotaxis protein n=1 Tax=Thalassospira lucentensis TaxID=168935 RepID=UPI003D2F0749
MTTNKKETSNAIQKSKGLGIRFKLGASFGAIAAMTAIAAIVGIVSIERISSALDTVTKTSSVAQALRAAEESSAIAVLASEMATNPNADIQSLSGMAKNRMQDLSDATRNSPLSEVAETLGPDLASLIDAALNRKQLDTKVSDAIKDLRNQHDGFLKTIEGKVSTANRELIDGSNDVIGSAAENLNTLITDQVGTLRSALTLQAEGNLLVSILIESANANNAETIDALKARFDTTRTTLSELGAASGSEALAQITENLLGFGIGDNNIFSIRRNELTATTQSSEVFRKARIGLEGRLHEAYGELIAIIDAAALPAADGFQMKAIISQSYAMMVSGIAANDIETVKATKEKFSAFYKENRKIPEAISADFKKPASDFFRLGMMRGALFDLRKQELEAIQRATETWSRLATERKEQLFVAHQAFRDAIAPVVEAADSGLRDRSAAIQDQSRSAISGLMEKELAALITMVRLEAAGNLAIGYQNQAAAAVDIDTLDQLANRLSDVAKSSKSIAANVPDASTIAQTAQTLTGLSVVTPKRDAVIAQKSATTALNDVRVAVEKMGVQGVAGAASKQSAAVTVESAEAITQGRIILIALGIGSLVLAGLLAWIYVGRGLIARLERIRIAMAEIAVGNTNVAINDNGNDELTEMSKTLEVFRSNAAEIVESQKRETQQREAATQERQAALNALANDFESRIKSLAEDIAKASEGMHKSAQTLSERSTTSADRSESAATATQATAHSVETVAAAAEELAASISEIRRQTEDSTRISRDTSERATQSAQSVQALNKLADEIGDVVTLISDIAEQTNMLALNATIEAARAGDAGKGFAVVANEVKHLADQTAKATADIGGRIKAVQNATQHASDEIGAISASVSALDNITTALSSAVEQQASATQEITRNAQAANDTTRRAADDVMAAKSVVIETGEISNNVLVSAKDLSNQATNIQREVDNFLSDIRQG